MQEKGVIEAQESGDNFFNIAIDAQGINGH